MSYVKRTIKFVRKKNKSYYEQAIELIFIIIPVAFFIRTVFYGLYQVPTGSMETTMLVGERFLADKFTVLFKEIERGMIISFNDPIFPYSTNPVVKLWQEYVWGPANWTKRVIGIPGDCVRGRMEEGHPVVYLKKKGESEYKKLDEPYLNKYPLIPIWNGPALGLEYINNKIFNDYFSWRSYDSKFSYADQPFYVETDEQVKKGKYYAKELLHETIREPGTPYMHEGRNLDIYDFELKENQYWCMGDNRLNSFDCRAWGPLKRSFIHGRIVFRIWSLDSPNAWWILDLIKHPIDFWKQIRWSRCWERVN